MANQVLKSLEAAAQIILVRNYWVILLYLKFYTNNMSIIEIN